MCLTHTLGCKNTIIFLNGQKILFFFVYYSQFSSVFRQLMSQESCQFLYGTSTVADGILHFASHFSECLRMSFWTKNGIIAKTCSSTSLLDYLPFHDTFEDMLFTVLEHQRNDRAEPGSSVCHSFHFVQQSGHIGFAVMSLSAGIACAVDTGSSVQGLDLQSRVVGKDVHLIFIIYV